MKIAFYFDLPAGGASRTMEELLKILEKKHQIDIYHNRAPLLTSSSFKRILSDLESIIFQRYQQKIQANQIDRLNYDLVFVSHDRHSQAPWVLRYLKTTTVFLCQEPTRAYFEEFLKIDPNLPLINRIYETINRYLRKRIEVKNASYATKIVSNSYYSSESIFRAYGRLATPMHLGVDLQEYYPLQMKRENQIVVVGNHEPQKALLFAIQVVSMIEKKYRPKLTIASPRDLDNMELFKMARKLNVKLRITVGINRSQLRKLYGKSKLTLAVAHLEPFGLSVVESLACGTPVVAVCEGGFRETIIQGKTGVLVERNPVKIASEISSLLKDSRKLSALGKAGIIDVKKRFTWDKSVRTLERVFYESKN